MASAIVAGRSGVREKLEKRVFAIMREAEARALDPRATSQRAFPRLPGAIVWEVFDVFVADQSYAEVDEQECGVG